MSIIMLGECVNIQCLVKLYKRQVEWLDATWVELFVLKYVCLVWAYEFKELKLPFYTRCCYVELCRYPKFYLEMDVVDMLGQPELLES